MSRTGSDVFDNTLQEPNPEDAARAGFLVLSDRLDHRELLDVTKLLPPDMLQLWPANAGAAAFVWSEQ